MAGRSEKAAHALIKRHGYKPPIDVELVARDLGIEVQFQDLESNISGLLVLQDVRATIVVNERHHKNRQRFSIAHEIGHHELHRGTGQVFIDAAPVFFRDNTSALGVSVQEIEANAFAAELLMPEKILRMLVREPFDAFDDIALRHLAAYFDVSAQALTIRLVNLDLMASWTR